MKFTELHIVLALLHWSCSEAIFSRIGTRTSTRLAFSSTLPTRPPSDSPDASEGQDNAKKLLGPGSRVAVAGADSLLGRLVRIIATQHHILAVGAQCDYSSRVFLPSCLAGQFCPAALQVTVKLAQHQFRPYIIVPSGSEPPHGLGLDRYWGITKHVMLDDFVQLPPEIEGLIMVDEKGRRDDLCVATWPRTFSLKGALVCRAWEPASDLQVTAQTT